MGLQQSNQWGQANTHVLISWLRLIFSTSCRVINYKVSATLIKHPGEQFEDLQNFSLNTGDIRNTKAQAKLCDVLKRLGKVVIHFLSKLKHEYEGFQVFFKEMKGKGMCVRSPESPHYLKQRGSNCPTLAGGYAFRLSTRPATLALRYFSLISDDRSASGQHPKENLPVAD